jgi:hypothetical protein
MKLTPRERELMLRTWRASHGYYGMPIPGAPRPDSLEEGFSRWLNEGTTIREEGGLSQPMSNEEAMAATAPAAAHSYTVLVDRETKVAPKSFTTFEDAVLCANAWKSHDQSSQVSILAVAEVYTTTMRFEVQRQEL